MGFFNNRDKYTVAYNGVSCNRYGLYLKERPNIPTATRRINEYDVLGKDGKMYEDTGLVEDRPLPLKIGFFGNEKEWTDKYRAVKKWLETPKSNLLPFRALQFTDDTEYYYLVKKITINTTEREARDIGQVEVEFIVDGYNYNRRGFEKEIMAEDTFFNEECKPYRPIVTLSRGYDDLGEFSLANIEIQSYIQGAYGLEVSDKITATLERGKGLILDLNTPSAIYLGGTDDPESGFSRFSGSFETLIEPRAIKWNSLTQGAEFSVTIQPLFKEY